MWDIGTASKGRFIGPYGYPGYLLKTHNQWFGVEGKNYYAATVRMVLTFDGCLRGTDICATRTEDL